MKPWKIWPIAASLVAIAFSFPSSGLGGSALVFQSDFGTQDGAVAAMKGVAFSVSPHLRILHLTHEIPAYVGAEQFFGWIDVDGGHDIETPRRREESIGHDRAPV